MNPGPFGQPASGPTPAMTLPRKVTFFALGAFVLDILIGAGFANMSASSAPTTLETDVVRWVALACLAVAGTAYLMGRRMRSSAGS